MRLSNIFRNSWKRKRDFWSNLLFQKKKERKKEKEKGRNKHSWRVFAPVFELISRANICKTTDRSVYSPASIRGRLRYSWICERLASIALRSEWAHGDRQRGYRWTLAANNVLGLAYLRFSGACARDAISAAREKEREREKCLPVRAIIIRR